MKNAIPFILIKYGICFRVCTLHLLEKFYKIYFIEIWTLSGILEPLTTIRIVLLVTLATVNILFGYNRVCDRNPKYNQPTCRLWSLIELVSVDHTCHVIIASSSHFWSVSFVKLLTLLLKGVRNFRIKGTLIEYRFTQKVVNLVSCVWSTLWFINKTETNAQCEKMFNLVVSMVVKRFKMTFRN